MDKYEVCTVDMVYTADRVVTVDAITIQTALPPLDYYDYWSTCGAKKLKSITFVGLKRAIKTIGLVLIL